MHATESTLATIGTYRINGRIRHLRIVRNPNGTWTADGPHEMRDFANRGNAVRWLKRIYAQVAVTWAE